MKNRLFNFFRRVVPGMEPVHPIEKQLAKQWIKRRLAAVFPELRNNAEGLHAAYEQLGLAPTEGDGKDNDAPTYQMSLPEVDREERE